MGLAGDHMFDARGFELLQRDRPVEAERGNGNVPVPAEMALRLAQHVAVGDRRIAGAVGNVERLLLLSRSADSDVGGEDDADAVVA